MSEAERRLMAEQFGDGILPVLDRLDGIERRLQACKERRLQGAADCRARRNDTGQQPSLATTR